jgi:hypothetical protein
MTTENFFATRRNNVLRLSATWWLDHGMSGGSKIGTRSGSAPQYNPASGRSWRPGGTFSPENALKLYQAMEALGCSASGVLNELVARMDVDDDGRPVWAADRTDIVVQPALIETPEPVKRLGAGRRHASSSRAAKPTKRAAQPRSKDLAA